MAEDSLLFTSDRSEIPSSGAELWSLKAEGKLHESSAAVDVTETYLLPKVPLKMYSPAVARSGTPQSRVLRRTMPTSSLLEEQMHKSMTQFSEMVDSISDPKAITTETSLFMPTAHHASEEHMSTLSAGTPAAMSLQIMDQTGLTQTFDVPDSTLDQTQTRDTYTPLSERPSIGTFDHNRSSFYDTSSLANKPTQNLTEDLFFQFHDHFISGPDVDITSLIDLYKKECESFAKEIEQLLGRGVRQEPLNETYGEWHSTALREMYTWEIIQELYSERLSAKEAMEDGSADKQVTRSELQALKHLLDRDSSFKQAMIILHWLENMASPAVDKFPIQVNYLSESLRWDNTLASLKMTEVSKSVNQNRVTKMDPDAVLREKKQLADIDREDDETLMSYLFICIRAGKIEKAQEVCMKIGQPWKAASLDGWQLHHDPNYYNKTMAASDERTVKLPCGNKFRDVWKLTAWEMSKEPGFDAHERAVYAAQCGNLKQILPVCQTWYDHLWAYVKVMVDIALEQELRSVVFRGRRKLADLPGEYWDQYMSLENVFEDLKSSPFEVIKVQSADPYHVVQEYIIKGDLAGLLSEMYLWLGTDRVTPNLLRFMAHVVQFIRHLGVIINEKHYAAVMKAFVDYLIREHKIMYSLVAVYCATLPPDLQVTCYASLLKRITDPSQQGECMERGLHAGLDMLACTKRVVEDVCNVDILSSPVTTDLIIKPTEEDKKMIQVLSWLQFDKTQRDELLIQSNRLVRMFLITKKYGSARTVFMDLPEDTIPCLSEGKKEVEIPSEILKAIDEYMSLKAYFNAQHSFSDWLRFYTGEQPTAPPKPVHDSYQEKLKYKGQLVQYHKEYKQWLIDLGNITHETQSVLFNVLLLPPNGWLSEAMELDGSTSDRRTSEMKCLRKLYLPQVCFLLHKVLHSTEDFKACLRLADVIVEEKYQLYKEFNKTDLEHMLQLLASSSTALLDKGMDAFGYNE